MFVQINKIFFCFTTCTSTKTFIIFNFPFIGIFSFLLGQIILIPFTRRFFYGTLLFSLFVFVYLLTSLSAKVRFYGKDDKNAEVAKSVAVHILRVILKLLHPYTPYITEKLWRTFRRENENLLISSQWPIVDDYFI